MIKQRGVDVSMKSVLPTTVQSGSLPVLFVFGHAPVDLRALESDCGGSQADSFPAVLEGLREVHTAATLRQSVVLLICDVALQHELSGMVEMAEKVAIVVVTAFLTGAASRELRSLQKVFTPAGVQIMVAEPCME
eukprot:5520165-Amphidinium_carterae.1